MGDSGEEGNDDRVRKVLWWEIKRNRMLGIDA